ncbi:MAG: CorA family divalent cation transporter, partial [Bacilli bacterium]
TVQIKELYQSSIDSNMNKTMQFFTVVSSVFLPLTLIVGWYGMNFVYMPELKWEYGYISVILISVMVLSLMAYFIHKKGFLKK